jgi:hypothetical protein
VETPAAGAGRAREEELQAKVESLARLAGDSLPDRENYKRSGKGNAFSRSCPTCEIKSMTLQ